MFFNSGDEDASFINQKQLINNTICMLHSMYQCSKILCDI